MRDPEHYHKDFFDVHDSLVIATDVPDTKRAELLETMALRYYTMSVNKSLTAVLPVCNPAYSAMHLGAVYMVPVHPKLGIKSREHFLEVHVSGHVQRVQAADAFSQGTTAEFLRERFACTAAEVLSAGRMLQRGDPGIAPERAGDVCDALQSRLSLSDPELRKTVLECPSVLGYSFDFDCDPPLVALQLWLSLSKLELKKVMLKTPSVLGYRYGAKIKPLLAALQPRLSLSNAELKKVVLRLPAVLGLSFEANLEPLLAALQSRLSLSEPELKKVVLGLPPVLGNSFEANIKPSLAALQLGSR